MMDKRKDRREFFRIRYPNSERRNLHISGRDYRVLDLSLGGVKFYSVDVSEFKVGQMIDAKISFHDETMINLFGEIIRIQNNEVAIKLSTPIPGGKINEEQRYLINKYIGYRWETAEGP
jgi:c-di-GMP-binding flagellar brake protein YcgR